MKRSTLLACVAVFAASACSYYDTGLLKFSADEPAGGQGGVAAAGSGGAVSGSGGGAGTVAGGAGGIAGAAGAAGAVAGAGGTLAGASGASGVSQGGGGNAGASGAAAGTSGAAGATGGTAGQGGSGAVCVRATVPTRPPPDVVGGGAGVGGSSGAGAGGKAGSNTGGKAGSSGGGAAGSSTGGAAGSSTGGAAGNPGVSTPDNIILALRTIDFAEKTDPTQSTVGFDIDGSCTCIDAPGEVCKPWKPRSTLCDGPGGRDNSFPRLLQTLVTFGYAQSSAQLTQTLETGNFTLLLRVQNWNRQPNDAEVTVSFYTSSGTVQPPEWTGKDVWNVLSNSVENDSIDQPTLRDTNAYVSDGFLVASLPTFDANDKKVLIQLNERFGLALSGTRVVGKLDELLGAYRILGGTLAGTWRDRDFFTQVATIKDPLDDKKTVCTDNFLYPQVKGGFCDIADLAGNSADLSGVCASTSIAMSFNAQEARLGPITVLPPPNTSTCSATTNPAQDGCTKK